MAGLSWRLGFGRARMLPQTAPPRQRFSCPAFRLRGVAGSVRIPVAMKNPVVLLVNGPNLDMLGRRDPAQYGTFTLADVERAFAAKCAELGVEPRFFQSGCEGELCHAIHLAMDYAAGIVINAGAYTHYSYALLDALLLARLPAMEVHISDVDSREPFRRVSVIRPACVGYVAGLGLDSYLVGLERLVKEHIPSGFRPAGD